MTREINQRTRKLAQISTKKKNSQNDKPSSFVTCMIDYLADICDYFLFKIIFKNIKNKKKLNKKIKLLKNTVLTSFQKVSG
jgi:hypothetical protein